MGTCVFYSSVHGLVYPHGTVFIKTILPDLELAISVGKEHPEMKRGYFKSRDRRINQAIVETPLLQLRRDAQVNVAVDIADLQIIVVRWCAHF